MQSVSISEAEKDISALLRAAQHEAIEIRSGNGDSAVLVSQESYMQLRSQQLLRACEELSAEAQANGLTEEKLAEILAQD